jgi:tetratricopeptide (TPR) repeat protein
MASEMQLDTLEAKGLIRLATYRPELEYLFRHWLVQDAAYGSLLKQERRELHLLVGQALEALYPDRRVELAGMLALHFEQAGETDKAVEYLVAAARHALDGNAIREAYSAFERARNLLPPAADDEDEALARRRLEIDIGLARAMFTFAPVDDLLADLEPMLPAAERVGDPESIATLHLLNALTRLQSGAKPTDPAVKRSLDRIDELGEQLHDPSLRAMPLALVGLTQVFSGSLRRGVTALEEAVPLMESRQNSIGAAFARGALAIGYANMGEFDKADEAARHASELAASGDLIAELDARIAQSMVHSQRGKLEEAAPLALACVNRAEETGATACVMASSFVLGDVYHRQGRFAEARDALQRGTDISLIVDRKGWRPTLQAWLGGAQSALGAEADDEQWEEALATARSIENLVGEAGILMKRAEVRVRRGELDEASTDYAASTAILEAEGARPHLARTLRAWGDSISKAGKPDQAREKYQRALALFEEMGISAEAGEVRGVLAAAVPASAG